MLATRVEMYRRIEAVRRRPLILYVTSARPNAAGMISGDVVPELMSQLNALPAGTEELDLLLVSNGGDPTAAWRIVTLIRERVKRFAVLVPQAAYSAATLIALGADEIVMHANGNLGPTDPQIRVPKKGAKDGASDVVPFGSEDLTAFLKFAREEVGLNDQSQMLSVFNHFCEEVGSVAVGIAARSAQLSISMGEKLLQLHMNGETNKAKARSISQALTSNYFHHGYAVSRSEAQAIELPVVVPPVELENLIWAVWEDLSTELQIREPFNPMTLLRANPGCRPLFDPVPTVVLPGNLPPQIQQQAFQAVLNQVTVHQVPPVEFELINAVMESVRVASRFTSLGTIFATRMPDTTFKVNSTADRAGWITMLVPQAPLPPEAAPTPAARRMSNRPRKSAKKSVRKAPTGSPKAKS